MEVNYKRVNDTDGELTLRFSDYKELMRFLEVTKCRSFVLTIKETIVSAVDERVVRRTFPKAGESAHRRFLTHHEENSTSDAVIAIYNRFEGRWYDIKYRCVVSLDAELRRHFKRYGTLYLTQKNTNHYLLEVLKSLKQMDVA
ncbi:MAG: hypothetical protein II395_10855 [Ruminococcus sp.]|nr:hypothetical protein [Ruminococcus sp.]